VLCSEHLTSATGLAVSGHRRAVPQRSLVRRLTDRPTPVPDRSRSLPAIDVAPRDDEQESVTMPKLKTHKGIKKRFKVSANGKVSHKRCGSSHLNSHKSGKQIRRLRKKSVLKVEAEAHRLRRAIHKNEGVNPIAVEKAKQAAMADAKAESLEETAPPVVEG